jgi:hypothetical protein
VSGLIKGVASDSDQQPIGNAQRPLAKIVRVSVSTHLDSKDGVISTFILQGIRQNVMGHIGNVKIAMHPSELIKGITRVTD